MVSRSASGGSCRLLRPVPGTVERARDAPIRRRGRAGAASAPYPGMTRKRSGAVRRASLEAEPETPASVTEAASLVANQYPSRVSHLVRGTFDTFALVFVQATCRYRVRNKGSADSLVQLIMVLLVDHALHSLAMGTT